jgi:hypothetical protein
LVLAIIDDRICMNKLTATRFIWALFSSLYILQKILYSPPHQISQHMHETLNID